MESAAARICREAGARVRTNVCVRDLNVGVLAPTDGRRIEVIADGLPLFHGSQLAVDTTLVSALRRNGQARPGADLRDGVALQAASRRKRETYPELCGSGARARLVVLGLEVGGRWRKEASVFLRLLAHARARAEPPLLRQAAQMAWQRRWMGILACAASRSFAASLLERSPVHGTDGHSPSTMDVLIDARHCGAEGAC